MCGIAGFIDFGKQSSKETLIKMTDSLSHRGPDGSGYEVWKNNRSFVGFGHRRLSIIDLSDAGAQPMTKHNFSIIFNGEIYNYKEIRSELKAFGYQFKSESDSEVILSAYHYWGSECVHHFRGMFAFAIHDHQANKVLIFRDRIGVKPLFFYEKNGLILFASELKAFHQHDHFDKSINYNAVNLYFKYGFVPNPICIFKHVRKIKPGHYASIDLNKNQIIEQEYWNASSFVNEAKPHNISGKQLEEEVEELLKESFEYRMVADVPVGVFLSGGYDSSLVTAMLQKNRTSKINTFTIGFENEKYNEANHANKVANYLGTNHHSYICTKEEAQNIIPDLPYYYDEPFADSSAIPTFLVSKITAQSVKVALSADGGDELFSGYNRNLRFLSIHKKATQIPHPVRKILTGPTSMMEKISTGNIDKSIWWNKVGAVLKEPSLLNIFDVYPQFFSDAILSKLTKYNSDQLNPQALLKASLKSGSDDFNALLSFDYQSTLTNDMLVKVDRASMANSLEGREPMLDHKIYEYMAKVPSRLKMKDGTLKSILKNITHKYIPKSIMERPKMGFGIPVVEWLQGDLKYLVSEHLQFSKLEKYDILNPSFTVKLVEKLMNNPSSQNRQLWLLLCFQMWCNRWL